MWNVFIVIPADKQGIDRMQHKTNYYETQNHF